MLSTIVFVARRYCQVIVREILDFTRSRYMEMRRNLIVNLILTIILITCIFEGKDNLENLGTFDIN